MNIYFTADTHLAHPNAIKFCNRPFYDTNNPDCKNRRKCTFHENMGLKIQKCNSIDKCKNLMDSSIINNWNSKVKPNDEIYILGDFAFKNHEFYLSQLNGKKHLIKGNHDKFNFNINSKFESIHLLLDKKINGISIVMCHYAMKVWNKSHYGAWHLYGHSHGTLPDNINNLSMDVG